jgi:hypothetical protein
MDTTADEAAFFRKECLSWQKEFGLTDWTLQFKTEPASPESHDEADIDYDCDTRHAVVTYYLGVKDALHPADVARHEILHLLFADMCLAGVNASSEEDAVLAREEHKVIERVLKVLAKLKSK